MDLKLNCDYEAFRDEVGAFLTLNRHRYDGAQGWSRPALLAWQALLIAHGYAARTVPRCHRPFAARRGRAAFPARKDC